MTVLKLILVIFMYIFTALLCLFIVGTLAQRMNMQRSFKDPKNFNIVIFTISFVIFIGLVFLVLNDWAQQMLR